MLATVKVLILPAKRNVDGKKAICHSSVCASKCQARRRLWASSTKELATRDDYSTPERLGNNWMKGLAIYQRVVMLFDDGGHGQRPHRLPL